jgi:predicted metal-dependent HD superfamily phosphohydrolase
MIKDEFFQALADYANTNTSEKLWLEIVSAYTNRSRHYHTLHHLENLYSELIPFKNRFTHWDALIFALVYHDIIYRVTKNDNEEKSAARAKQRLQDTGVPTNKVEYSGMLILATKKHEPSTDEVNLFTDADLSVLGSTAEVYEIYTLHIRKEYAIFPDLLYKPGRKKVLEHFLAMDRIFKTKEFFDRYELRARINLQTELNSL